MSAYIVAGLSAERIRPILDVALARFEHEQALRQGLTEQAAFAKLRKAAMDKGLKLADVAQRMLDMADLLG